MDLIDWLGVARNALWILGLSIVLAAWSHLRWWAMSRQIKLRRAWEWPRFQAPFSAGLILFCISLPGAQRGGGSAVCGLLWALLSSGNWSSHGVSQPGTVGTSRRMSRRRLPLQPKQRQPQTMTRP
jgi:hypothetical protein